MIVRFNHGGGVHEVDSQGKPISEEENKTSAVVKYSGSTLPEGAQPRPDIKYKPEKMFFCNDCRTYSDYQFSMANHKGHKGAMFTPKEKWFDNRIACVLPGGRVIWASISDITDNAANSVKGNQQ